MYPKESKTTKLDSSAKQQLRVQKHQEQQEDAALRLAAQTALLKLEHNEHDAFTNDLTSSPSQLLAGISTTERSAKQIDFINGELQHIRLNISSSDLRLCTLDGVHIHVHITSHRAALLKINFSLNYPQTPLVIDLESKTLHEELVAKLQTACAKESQKHVHGGQVLPVATYLRTLLQHNKLCAAYGDLQQLSQLGSQQDASSDQHQDDHQQQQVQQQRRTCEVLSSKERAGTVKVMLRGGHYHMQLELTVPDEYPHKAVDIQLLSSNLPQDMQRSFLATATDLARRLAEPPAFHAAMEAGRAGAGSSSKSRKQAGLQSLHSSAKERALRESLQQHQQQLAAARQAAIAAHVSRPSLAAVVQCLLQQCLLPVACSRCPECGKRLLPADPACLAKVPRKLAVLRLCCGHMYHHQCIEQYLARPPFGKGCHVCGIRVAHHLVVSDAKVLEARWAAGQARGREVGEVVDFLG